MDLNFSSDSALVSSRIITSPDLLRPYYNWDVIKIFQFYLSESIAIYCYSVHFVQL